LIVALAGCGGEQTEDATLEEEPEAAEQDSSICMPVKPWLKRAIAEGLTVMRGHSVVVP
jgi:hypothetical protein